MNKEQRIQDIEDIIEDIRTKDTIFHMYFICNHCHKKDVDSIVEDLADFGKENIQGFEHSTAFGYPVSRGNYNQAKIDHLRAYIDYLKQ